MMKTLYERLGRADGITQLVSGAMDEHLGDTHCQSPI